MQSKSMQSKSMQVSTEMDWQSLTPTDLDTRLEIARNQSSVTLYMFLMEYFFPNCRANPYVFTTKTFQPTASGIYIIRVVASGTSGSSSLNERLELLTNSQSFARSMYHGNSTHLEVGSLVNLKEGLQLNESNTQIQSFAGTFLTSTFDSEGFTSRLASRYDASMKRFYRFEGFSDFPVNNFKSGNITSQTVLTLSKAGLYFITVNVHFTDSSGLNELKYQNAVNSVLYSAVKRNSSSYTLKYYGFLYLESGNVFDFGIDTNEDQSFSVLDGSTVSLAYFGSIAQFDGFIAASSASQMLIATNTTPTVLKEFDSFKNIDKTKGFYPREATFFSYNPGVYLVTANIVVKSKSSQMR